MGCAQTSPSVISPSHIPIERLYDNEKYPSPPNQIPIEQLYDNEGYPSTKAPPVVIITAPPIPAYVKSALKKPNSDGRGVTEGLSFFNRKPPPFNKSVNFDEQVLVKSRTPTPNKIWYEKPSSTMPKRKHPGNDDDDYDYDDEEIESISSDEEEENDEQINTESQIPTLRSPTLLSQRNQANTLWHNTNTIGSMPTTNTMLENESFSSTMQQSPFNMNIYPTEIPISLPINRIKVRRRLPNFGPPQIAPAPSYQSSPQSLTVPPYQSPTRPSTVPPYQIPTQSSTVPPYQIPTQSSTVPPYQIPTQSSSNPPYQIPTQSSTASAYQIPTQSSTNPPYQSSVQPPNLLSYQSPIQRTLSNANAALIKHQPTLTNGESSLQTAYYAVNRHPKENVT
jgi:hypothetical protein